MPIFVDHAGMNTLINQELDLTTNTLHTGSNRVKTGIVQDRALENFSTNTVAFAGLRSDNTTGNYTGQLTQTNGLSFSFWVKLNSTNHLLHRTVFQAWNGSEMSTWRDGVIQIWFNEDSGAESILFQVTDDDSSNDPSGAGGTAEQGTWSWNVNDWSGMSYTNDFYDKWVHIYIDWNGRMHGADSVVGDTKLYINGVSAAPGNFTNGWAGGEGSVSATMETVEHISLFDAGPENNTLYELDGALQNFTLYNSHSLSRVSDLYNAGVATVDLGDIPDHSSVVAHFYLGNETVLNELEIGVDGPGTTEIVPVLGHVTAASGFGALEQSTALMRVCEGQRGSYVTSSGGIADGYVGKVAETQRLVALNTHRNGPYGYSSWQQQRISNNHLSRHHRKTNTMTFVTDFGPLRNTSIDGTLKVRDRFSPLYSYIEPPVAQKGYPLVWNVGRHFKDEDGNVDMDNPQRFSILSSYGNQQIAFANDKVSRLHKFDPNEEQTEYVSIKDMYLENGLNKLDSPLTHWEFIQYRETVFPKEVHQYMARKKSRPQFVSFYRHTREDRNVTLTSSTANAFGYPESVIGYRQSTWPLDVEDSFLTDTKPGTANYGNIFNRHCGVLTNLTTTYAEAMSTGVQFLTQSDPDTVALGVGVLDGLLAPFPVYARRVSLTSSMAHTNPSGMYVAETGSEAILFEGNALWEAGTKRQVKNVDGSYSSSVKYPFYDTYDNYVEDVRNYGKNYCIVPEFRMHSQIENYLATDGEIEVDMFEVTGGESGLENSSKGDFFEVYSNTDFMKNFEIIADDHEDFTNGKVLSMRCKAIKKFLPYEGFYPCQRTVDISKRFYDSFKNNIKLYNVENVEIDNFNYGRQLVMTPLFAPGVLFNTIKSGVAVDYPIVTSSVTNLDVSSSSGFMLSMDYFDKRIPFEALVEPAKYLSEITLTSNEPDIRANLSSSAVWDGEGDNLFSLMSNNFLAESINFFLPNGQLTSLVSKKQKDIKNFKVGQVYGMRVKMRRSMSGTRYFVSGNADANSRARPYTPPQDLIRSGEDAIRETFTMYSRPSAFGPPSRGFQARDHEKTYFETLENDRFKSVTNTFSELYRDSEYGFNFPFTPPYYHGEGWCEIWMTASAASMTIKEIQNAVTMSFSRFDNTYLTSSSIPMAEHGPQTVRRINDNAVQLSASLNILGIGTIRTKGKGGSAGSLVVDSGLAEENRWVIQTKFETPMLNFNHITGSDHITLPDHGKGSLPRGMWHQYGRIPNQDEGVYLEVGEIPKNYQLSALGRTTEMKDLSEHLGFSAGGTKLGRLAGKKEISEAVVAVPFISIGTRRKFFSLDKEKIDIYKAGLTTENEDAFRKLTNGSAQEQLGKSVLNQIKKMEKFVFPPSFDFINFDTDKVTPVAMYIFEFSHTLTQTDLQDIWQNLPPTIGTEMEVAEVAITHPLLKKELLGPGGEGGTNTIEMPEKLKWMVFKVKQRANNNYFKKTTLRNPNVNQDVDSGNVTQDEFGLTGKVQYNWPYDYFSLVEMVKLDAEVEMGNADFSNYTDNIPNWDPVQAEPEKIEHVIGGLEDEPIPEINPPEAIPVPEQAENLGLNIPMEMVEVESAGGISGMARAAVEAVSQAQQNQQSSDESAATIKRRIHHVRTESMQKWKDHWWWKYDNTGGTDARRTRKANAYANDKTSNISNFGGFVVNEKNNPYNNKDWYYSFTFSADGSNYSSTFGISMDERH